jgi:hypothetical protein
MPELRALTPITGPEPEDVALWVDNHANWISNLPADTKAQRLARLARIRWMIELSPAHG